MPVVTRLNHTRLRVDDLERTVEFYKTILGLEEVRRHTSPRGSQLAFLKAPNSEELIEITYFPDSGPVQVQEDLIHLAFEVDSMEEFVSISKRMESNSLMAQQKVVQVLLLRLSMLQRDTKSNFSN